MTGLSFGNIVLDLTEDLLYNSYSPLWLFLGIGIGAALGYIIGSSGKTGEQKEGKIAAPTTSTAGPPSTPPPSSPSGPPSTPPPSSPSGPPSTPPPSAPVAPPGKPKKGAPPPPPPPGAGASGSGSAEGLGLLTPKVEPCPDLYEDASGAICKLTGGPLGESRLNGLCKAEWKNCSIRRAMRT